MPHQGRSVQALWDEGIRDISVLQHAALDESGTLDFIGGLSLESQQEAIEGSLVEGAEAEFDLDEWMRRREEEEADGGRAESITTTGTREERARTEQELTREERVTTDELITRISREYFDVETPEEFLDNFSNAFVGFAESAAEAGLSQTDVAMMFDPSSGFMQSMLNEYMGEMAQRAERGEDIWEVVGVGGEPELVGRREGEVTTTEIERLTRTEAEQVLTERGEEITNESIQSIIDEDFQRRQESLTTTLDREIETTEETVRRETGVSRFRETEEVFRRPQVARVFKFSPTEFLQERFPDSGMLSTVIRARAGQQRALATRGTTGVVAGVQRA